MATTAAAAGRGLTRVIVWQRIARLGRRVMRRVRLTLRIQARIMPMRVLSLTGLRRVGGILHQKPTYYIRIISL
ncbi:MAG: hypothetical protein GX428_05165 [Candidatus Atribacteria bacterium]|nr:hypothetical protein [Candidatus Atribacteria bacterium]